MFSSNTTQVSSDAAYIEDVFSTWLYTGNGSTQTINNGIDLAGKGGLVWMKRRSGAANHQLYDTARGATKKLASNEATAEATETLGLTAFNSTGFALGSDSNANGNGSTYVSWTFREQPRFFDIVTYTGDGAVARAISHNLGSAPGCMIVKRTNAAGDWRVYHIGCSANNGLLLNTADAQVAAAPFWFGDGSTTIPPTSTQFTVNSVFTNNSGDTYVAYLFAHNAGGFGATGADNVISCGSYTGNGSTTGPVVTLGYEPQWIMIKSAGASETQWIILDSMRGMAVNPNFSDAVLTANTSDDESVRSAELISPTATGFQITSTASSLNLNGQTYIYIAIRRGPMRTPTSGTSVFQPLATTITSGVRTSTALPYVDGVISKQRNDGTAWNIEQARLTGTGYLRTESTAAEAQAVGTIAWDAQNAVGILPYSSGQPYAAWLFRRAPGFFDVVCYTGTGVARTVNHNLGVAPEFIIVKQRASGGTNWRCYHSANGATNGIALNLDLESFASATYWNDTAPTSSVFTVGTSTQVNASGGTYVAYLFASCPGVSRVGSFTGTGSTQTINCGFTAGARFVLIKRTDSTGDWYVWDSARGIVAGNDPYLLLNSTAAEVTNTDWVDTAASGFELSNAGGNLVNINGASYIFLSVA